MAVVEPSKLDAPALQGWRYTAALMTAPDEQIRSLRVALQASPDNVPLLVHLADVLTSYGRYQEAESEYRAALRIEPDSTAIQLSLATCYFEAEQDSHAHVLVEALLKRDDAPPAARVLRARLCLREGDSRGAVHAYREALDEDPSLEDPALSERLGVSLDPPDLEDEIVDGRVRARSSDEGGGAAAEVERPRGGFETVGGMEDLKEEIALKIIKPMAHPELFAAYGKAIGGGIMLYGPPGCGKTHLARATAGEVRASFLAVGISDVLDMWIGQSERNLAGIFAQARAEAPSVLFFDEVDALGAKRNDMRQSAGRQLINQFLSELDGYSQSNDGLLVLAATNAPWHMDSAFRRPGRFDRIIFVPPPDEPARAAILRLLLQDKPTRAVDYEHVAKKTRDYSGADLKGLVDRAVEGKLQDALKAGAPVPLTTKDLLRAAKGVKPSTRDWFATARNHALYANQGGLYDDVLAWLDRK